MVIVWKSIHVTFPLGATVASLSIWRFIFKCFLMCPVDYTAVTVSEKVGSVDKINYNCLVALIPSTDRSKSVTNRCVIELFCDVFMLWLFFL